MKFKLLALGVATGILWGLSLFVVTLLSVYTGYGETFLNALPQALYPGYDISVKGSFFGLIIGFFDGVICASIFGWVYNKIAEAQEKKS
ncbi:MAG: bacteriophage holin [Thermodesulfovibrionia bacterium]|nr:bacteriophage holin [Thermodesulfovibrionia bacterium]